VAAEDGRSDPGHLVARSAGDRPEAVGMAGGVQAGGVDYLKQFLWTRVVSENTLRHGFVPPIVQP